MMKQIENCPQQLRLRAGTAQTTRPDMKLMLTAAMELNR